MAVYQPPRKIIHPLLLLILPFLLYANTFQSTFHFDDHAYILNEANIDDFHNILYSLLQNFFTPDRSLTTLSFAVNHALHGFDLPGYHFINILIHGLNGWLLFLILKCLLRERRYGHTEHHEKIVAYAAFAAALAFLVHPLAVNSITYISQRHGTLATTFFLAGFFFYLCSLSSKNSWTVWLYRGFSAVCFWSAIHCKPMALTLPLVILAYESLRLMMEKEHKKRDLPRFTILLIAFVIFCMIAGAFAYGSGLFSKGNAVAGFRTDNLWTPWVHFLTESKVFIYYLKIIFLPLPQWLCVDHAYPITRSIDGAVLFSWLIHGLVFTAVIWAYASRLPITAFGIVWFYLTISPPYLLLPIADVMVEYKTYLPSIGIYMAFTEMLYFLSQRWDARKIATIVVLFILTASYGTILRNRIFATEITFWTDSIQKYPSAPRPYNNRGLALHASGDYFRAIADFEQVLKIDPTNQMVYANLGDSYKELNDFRSATRCYLEYIKRQPDKANGHVRLGNILALQRDWRGAVHQFQEAVRLEPDNQVALYNLGLGYGHLGRQKEMVKIFKKIITDNPEHFKAWSGLGVAYHSNGDRVEAIRHFTRALKIEPLFAEALFNLAVCYLETGERQRAQSITETLLKIDPQRGELLKDHLVSKRPAESH